MKSEIREAVEKFFAQGKFSRFDQPEVEITTREEAEEFCRVFKETLASPSRAARLLRAFQPEEPAQEVFQVFRDDGVPLLLELEPCLMDDAPTAISDRLFLLKLLTQFATEDGTDRIIAVAQSGFASEAYMWSSIIGGFNNEHPHCRRFFSAFKLSLPSGFAAVTLLDAANQCALDGGDIEHPYDSPSGIEMLRGWLRDLNPEHFSYAHSATAALPFMTHPARNELLELAMDHPDPGVSVEAAWAAAKMGMERGIRNLARFAVHVNTSSAAVQLLEELGREDAIPAEAADPNFQAMATMVAWLSHPSEFGEPPARISIVDTRELYWPPTQDRRQLWLLRYEYPRTDEREADDIGLGMVGSVTFALFGETTADLTPLQAYALHCCWELETNGDPLAPKKRTVQAGLTILGGYNELPDNELNAIAAAPDIAETDDTAGESQLEESYSDDPASDALSQILAHTKDNLAKGNSEKRALRSAMKQLMEEQTARLKKEVEEFRTHLVAKRKLAPAVQTSTRRVPMEAVQHPDVERQRNALEAAGYRLEGIYAFENIPGFQLFLFGHSENGTTASISSGKDLTTEIGARYPDGRGFNVRDTAAVPGLTPAPWITYRYEPGRSVAELVAIFDSSRPPGHSKITGAEAAATLAADFRKVQLWRMERGGWNRDEVQTQLRIADAVAEEERLSEMCLAVRETWLYAWFKDRYPELAEGLMESLVIVHDEMDGALLYVLWMMGGGSSEVRTGEFDDGNPREVFSQVNLKHGRPLTLIACKQDGFPADFYRPADQQSAT